jgi:hypothetical protein
MKWGYKAVHFEMKKGGLIGSAFFDESEIEEALNNFGAAGWELISVLEVHDGVIAFFKQPLAVGEMAPHVHVRPPVAHQPEDELPDRDQPPIAHLTQDEPPAPVSTPSRAAPHPPLGFNEVNKAAEENPGGEDSGEDERVGAIRIE